MKTWKEVRKEFIEGFTEEELKEIEFEKQRILDAIDARKKEEGGENE